MEKEELLANILVNYSVELKAKEKVLIEATNVPDSFLELLIKQVQKVGAYPFVLRHNSSVKRQLLLGSDKYYAETQKKYLLPVMKDMNAYIGIRASDNTFELSDVPESNIKINTKFFVEDVLKERVDNTKWVILNYPTPAFAQASGLSTKQFEKYFFDVCTFDYEKLSGYMLALKNLMEKTDKVHILGKGTDISFSIKGIPAIICAGKNNIPDGEVFTAPVLHSVNGQISYTIGTIYDGKRFDNVCLQVKNGKIVNATSSQTASQNFILDSDEGARYFGEFAIGVNPFVKKPVLDILFDEKMFGSFHLTPGACYEEAYNTNKSCVHWDLVCCQTSEYGGGEIYFDDVLVRKNGEFVLKELLPLNFKNEVL